MSAKIAAFVVSGILFTVAGAYAQESTRGPGLVEVTYMPAGAAFFTSSARGRNLDGVPCSRRRSGSHLHSSRNLQRRYTIQGKVCSWEQRRNCRRKRNCRRDRSCQERSELHLQ